MRFVSLSNHHIYSDPYKMNAAILSTVDDETKLRIVAGLLSDGTLTDQQKTYFLEITKGALEQFTIESNVKVYVRDHPDFLLERMFPPIDTKKFPDGNISIGAQQSYTKALAMVFNCLNSKENDMWVVSDGMHEDFLSGNWLHDVPTVDSALKKRNSRGKSRRCWYDACRQLCRVFEITDAENPCDWPAITKQYETLIKYIDYGKDDQETTAGTHDGKQSSEKYKDMSVEQAGEHIQSVRDYSSKLLAFVQPLLESLIGKTEKQLATGLSKTYIFADAIDGHNKKRLGTWALDCILMVWKHGQCDDADLRPMRCGDCFRFRYASVNSATGFGSWILFGDGDQVIASMKNSSTKIGASACIPLHDRCPELAKFLKIWYTIMKIYQDTDTPWLACRISTFKASRVPLEGASDSFNQNKRAFLSAGLKDASQNMTRVASSRKKRDGPNRSDETLHSAAQEQNYQNRELKRPRI
eukprot:COSAG05_NODE_353_length_10881_cov_72.725839_2_plen_470_part_00